MNRKNFGKLFWGMLGLALVVWNLPWGNFNQRKKDTVIASYPKENTETAQPVYISPVKLIEEAFDSSGIPEVRIVYVRGLDLITQTNIGIGIIPAVVDVVNTENSLI